MGGRSRCTVAEHVLTHATIPLRAGGAAILRHHRHAAFLSRLSARAPTLLAGAPRPPPPSTDAERGTGRRDRATGG